MRRVVVAAALAGCAHAPPGRVMPGPTLTVERPVAGSLQHAAEAEVRGTVHTSDGRGWVWVDGTRAVVAGERWVAHRVPLREGAIELGVEVTDFDLLWPGEAFASYGPRLIRGGAQAVVLKRGAQGCIGIGTDLAVIDLAGHRVEVVDPTGAGDCFCATFVALHAMGMPLDQALVRANAAGALAVQRLGPMEGNSTQAAIDAFLEGRA